MPTPIQSAPADMRPRAGRSGARGLGFVVAAATLALGISSASSQDVSFRAGTLPRQWEVSGPNCAEAPDFQVHEYNPDFFIIRQSGCTHHEKPFIYLMFGNEQALLLDTGAGFEEDKTTTPVDVVGVVDHVIEDWLMANDREDIPLVVAHLHSHGDHTAGDADFAARPNTTFVAKDHETMSAFFGITNWPEESAEFDLGDRIVAVIPIPGHDTNSFAYYDYQTGVLLTGDSLYPGRVYVNGDPAVFAASTQRLVDFAMAHPVTWILGTHIEQTRTPFVDYVVGTAYQPDEAPLEMTVGQLVELNEYLKATMPDFTPHRFVGFSVCGGYPTCDAQTVTVTE